MIGNRLRRFDSTSQQYQQGLTEIADEMAPRAAKGAQLKKLLEMAGIDVGTLQDLKLRYDPDVLEAAVRKFGPDFRTHLPEEVKIPAELKPKESWLNRWENEREARQPQVPNGGKGAVESE